MHGVLSISDAYDRPTSVHAKIVALVGVFPWDFIILKIRPLPAGPLPLLLHHYKTEVNFINIKNTVCTIDILHSR